jgi:hypothetical protein
LVIEKSTDLGKRVARRWSVLIQNPGMSLSLEDFCLQESCSLGTDTGIAPAIGGE